jgi:hypothetical protein
MIAGRAETAASSAAREDVGDHAPEPGAKGMSLSET